MIKWGRARSEDLPPLLIAEDTMKIGAHVSAAGGLQNAPKNAASLGLECFQFFSRPPQSGKAPAIPASDIKQFKETCAASGFDETYIHSPYIINLASSENRIRGSSIRILREELERGSALGVTAMMAHIGSARGVGEEEGVKMVIDGMKKILTGYSGTTRFLVEISAGAGMIIGDTFEELKEILDGVSDERTGLCFDTAHAFASGYDLRNAEAVEKTMKEFDEMIGLERLEVSHCNDSKVGLGAKKDRHEHIGEGLIGLEGFKAIVASPVFRKINLILETPVDGVENDIALLKKLRG